MSEDRRDDECRIISMIDFREKKGLSTGPSLCVSHLNGKIGVEGKTNEFSDRLQRIKVSLEKINLLMSELKKVSSKDHSNSDK